MHIQTVQRGKARGFSLIELLSVMAIIGLLATAAVPAVGDMAASSRRTQFLSDISGLLENARQYAIAKNTYVWVAFTGEDANNLSVVAVASRNGLGQGYGPDDSWSAQIVDISNSAEFVQVCRVKSLGDFTVKSTNHLDNGLGFRVKQSGKPVDFTRSIQFSPDGSAKIAASIQGKFVLNTQAANGRFADRLELNGPTGFVQIATGAE